MPADESLAASAARRLWEHADGAAGTRGDAYLATDRVLTDLEGGLRRWIGAEGYAALLSRATAVALTQHPALGAIEDLGATPLPAGSPRPSDADIRAAVITLLATLTELLGRIIGIEMAIRLVEQVGRPSPRGIVSIEPEGKRDE